MCLLVGENSGRGRGEEEGGGGGGGVGGVEGLKEGGRDEEEKRPASALCEQLFLGCKASCAMTAKCANFLLGPEPLSSPGALGPGEGL